MELLEKKRKLFAASAKENTTKKQQQLFLEVLMILKKQLFHYQHCCYFCERNIFIEIHHKDLDRGNNNFNNYLILCRRCYRKLHKLYAENIKAAKQKNNGKEAESDVTL